jgi:hypothetical protein
MLKMIDCRSFSRIDVPAGTPSKASQETAVTHRPKLAILAAAALWVLLACGDARPPGDATVWAGTVDTLSSGRVLIRNPDAPSWRGGERFELRERFRIGSLAGDGPDLFGEIRDIELGPDGELYVLDAQVSEVRVFGGDGAHLRTFGRPGEGPGELSRPAGMAVGPDETLWVLNAGNARYSGFDPGTGELRNEIGRPAAFLMIPWPGRFDRSGRLLDVGLGSGGRPVILGLDSAFQPSDTLEMPQVDERYRVDYLRGTLRVASAVDPYAPQPSWAAHPAGGIAVGEGEAYRLHRIDFDGDTALTIEVSRAPVRVTAAEADSALAVFKEMIGAQTAGAVPQREPRVARSKPAHGAVFVDDRERIWVARMPGAGEGAAWDVIAADGRLLGFVHIDVVPSYGSLSIRGDRVAIGASVEGVPTVVVYDLVRSDP